MNGKGIEFYYRDGTCESYDPINDWKETKSMYSFWVGWHEWNILKSNVLELREYPLCDVCGYEVYDDGCRKCAEEKELKLLKDETKKL